MSVPGWYRAPAGRAAPRYAWGMVILATLAASGRDAPAAESRARTVAPPPAVASVIAPLHQAARARDSLSALADSSRGATRDYLDERIRQRNAEIHDLVLDAVAKIRAAEAAGGSGAAPLRAAMSQELRADWPRSLARLQQSMRELSALSRSSDVATGAARLAIESEMSQLADRMLESYRSLVNMIAELEGVGVDVSEQRRFLVQMLPTTAEGMVTRVQLASRAQTSAGARLSQDGSNADLRYEFEAAKQRVKRATAGLSTTIQLMNRLNLPTTNLRVALIASNGRITADIFDGPVLLGLIRTLWTRLLEFLAGEVTQWLFQGLLVVLTFLGFRALAQLVRRGVRRAVRHSSASALMRDTLVRLSGGAVMVVGIMVILTQLGVQIAPLLAGFGIAGVVVGFAMQNTLSNFASGGMILWNRPFDVGDEIEASGAVGIVKRMSLVSTTILTPDNQVLIVPNSTIWGGVIRNRTALPTRRVDLMFGIGYGDDVELAERVLREIVAGEQYVLQDPEPIIRLHQLADSSVNFAVRVWTAKERYWDVAWSLTRSVKLRFDQEGISIPFPQRDLHVSLVKDESAALAALGAAPATRAGGESIGKKPE